MAAITWSSVDLPEPEGPMSAKKTFARNLKVNIFQGAYAVLVAHNVSASMQR